MPKVIQFTIPEKNESCLHIKEDKQPYFYPHFHRHIEIQMTWVISGEGTLIIGNNMHPFQSGDLFIIGANQPHLFKSDPFYFEPESRKKIHSLNIFFNPTGPISHLFDLPEMYTINKFIKSSSHGVQASEKSASKLQEYILKVKNNKAGSSIAYFIEMLQKMADVNDWKYLSTESLEYVFTDTEGLKMNDIYRYTMDHFTEEITLEQIASVAHLTPQSFCRYFKKHTSKTYVQFLNEVRINEACRLIMERNFSSIGSVAYQCGFNSVVSFNRVFKGVTSKTPREYIKSFEEKD